MTNSKLAADYFWRCKSRLKVLELLFNEGNYPDCVCEAQELVELALKGVLRKVHFDPPHWHDVSSIIESAQDRLPPTFVSELARIKALSSHLRKERENAFYGDDDMVPTEIFTKEQAEKVVNDSRWLLNLIENCFKL